MVHRRLTPKKNHGSRDHPIWLKSPKSPHLVERIEISAHLPCPDVTGQKASPRAIELPGILVGFAAGPWREAAFPVMERALKHKYPVGATVYFTASNVSRPAATGTYEVIRQLPSEGDDCQYRIKSSTEAFERVARESQLAAS